MIFENVKGEEFRFCGDFYAISNFGRLYSFCSMRFISLGINAYGYPIYSILTNGVQRARSQHRIMAIAFIDNPMGKEQVNHIDGVKINNVLSNLEWVTAKENMQHAHSIGLTNTSKPSDVDCVCCNCSIKYKIKNHVHLGHLRNKVKNTFCNMDCKNIFSRKQTK